MGAGVLGSAVAMDKLAMKAAFAAAGLAQVPYVGLNAADLQEPERRDAVVARIEQELGYPCFVKPANLGSSVITKARIAASCSAVSTKRRPLTPASWWSRR